MEHNCNGRTDLIIDTEEEIYQYGQIFTAKDTIIENVIGSAYDDIIYGNDSDNVINSENGSDVIHGGSGSDFINGGEGDDEIYIALVDISDAEDIIDGGGGDSDKLYCRLVQITAMSKLEMH